jgi:hypothetical protein
MKQQEMQLLINKRGNYSGWRIDSVKYNGQALGVCVQHLCAEGIGNRIRVVLPELSKPVVRISALTLVVPSQITIGAVPMAATGTSAIVAVTVPPPCE